MEALDLSFNPPRGRTSKVRVGQSVLGRLVDELAADPPGSLLVVVSDSNVGPLYAEPLCARLREAGLRAEPAIFAAGEASKTRETKAILEDRLLDLGAARDSAVVAVGGGVTGDLAGFVAATWHRGIPVVQVPTSLLAMVDASIGGKTAVNLPAGKNLVGSFHQPWGVYADTSTLITLPREEYVNGLAEVVKSALIADRAFFRRLETHAEELLDRRSAALQQAILRCIEIKARVVKRDEREAGRRAVLNFGHTVGHALEAVSRYAVPHGAAVAVGMCVEARLARQATGFPEAHVRRLDRLAEALGLPVRLPEGLPLDALAAATYRDKKVRGGRVYYALPVRIGRMLPEQRAAVPIDESSLREALAEVLPAPTN